MSLPNAVGRLISAEHHTGSFNMSADQAILESVDQGGLPTLRFYYWKSPTLSLGYFQRHHDRELHSGSVDIDWVRRSTGGGAIVHDRELTYSLALPTDSSRRGANAAVYKSVHAVVANALSRFGIKATRFGDDPIALIDEEFLCFQRRTDEDLICSGYKVVGSAQRRGRSAVLQHGSILLNVSPFAPELPGVCDLSGRDCSANELADEIATELGHLLGLRWESGSLSSEETIRAGEIEGERFANPRWLGRR